MNYGENDWLQTLLGRPGQGVISPGWPGAPQVGMPQAPVPQAQPQKGIRGLLGDRDLALALLANSGNSPQKRGFGEILGTSAIQADQMKQGRADDAFKRQYMQAQMERMQNPSSANRFGAVSPDKFTRESIAKFEQTGKYGDLEQIPAGSTQQMPQTMEGPDGSKIVWDGKRFQVVQPPKPTLGPKPPLGYSFNPDGSLTPIKGGPADSAQTADNKPPTEGERTAGNYYGRMKEAEALLAGYQPSNVDYMAARKVMNGGPVMGGIANAMLSPKAQMFYQAASDWVRAKLRKESGAVIAPEEMEQEIKTYFPMPGDSQEVIEQKAKAREQATFGMRNMGGRASGDYDGKPPNKPGKANDDPLGIR
jgi:hypothetical protein